MLLLTGTYTFNFCLSCAWFVVLPLCFSNSVKWVQIKGTRYSKGSVTVIEADIIPTFGLIIDLLMVDVDVCLFVCEVLTSEYFEEHLHAFKVSKESPVSLAICRHKELADHHVLSLYKHHHSLYVVPKYNLDV